MGRTKNVRKTKATKKAPKKTARRTRISFRELEQYSDDDYEYEDQYFEDVGGKLVPFKTERKGKRQHNKSWHPLAKVAAVYIASL